MWSLARVNRAVHLRALRALRAFGLRVHVEPGASESRRPPTRAFVVYQWGMTAVDLSLALDVARRAAAAASAAALIHFERGVRVERKPDQSPVTEADRASEQAILSVITETFPTHSILAEESGRTDRDPQVRWIIDPIDGTRGFTRGGQFWGSLIALEIDGTIAVGTMALPALGETYFAARGHGCFVNDTRIELAAPQPGPLPIDRTTLSLGELRLLLAGTWGAEVQTLIQEAENARCYGDLMGPALVLKGVADAWLEAGVAPWDIAPVPILFEEAGAVFTNFRGDTDLRHGTALAATSAVHAGLLRRLEPVSDPRS